MLSLIFRIICWQQGCRPSLVLFFIELTIFLFFSLILLFIFYVCEFYCWRKKLNIIVDNQKEYYKKTLPLVDSAKISMFSINSIKTPLTSLRLILDNLKDPSVLKDKTAFSEYLIMADSLLLQVKKREELLNKQLFEQEEVKLFDLVEEIQSLLTVYREMIVIKNIDFQLLSDKEYRIFADQDHLLRVINIILINSIESLILSNKDDKRLKIYFKRSPYLLKIYLEDNLGIIDSQATNSYIRLNTDQNKGCQYFNLSLYCANQIMKKYYQKGINIKVLKNIKTIYCLKIKTSYILAEPKIKE